jgi:hypothetical protein
MLTSAQPPSPARTVPVSPIEARAVELEVELLRKTFGIFKISTGAITFQWTTGATSQRSLDTKWVNSLCASFRSTGLQRVLPGHHIVATVERSAFEEAVRHTISLGYADPTLPLDLEALPDGRPVPYAEHRFPDGLKVEGQSGQHRTLRAGCREGGCCGSYRRRKQLVAESPAACVVSQSECGGSSVQSGRKTE